MRDELRKNVVSTMNCKTAHRMIVTKFFFSLAKQLLKTWSIQVSYGDHESLLLALSNIDCTIALWNCRNTFVSFKKMPKPHVCSVRYNLYTYEQQENHRTSFREKKASFG